MRKLLVKSKIMTVGIVVLASLLARILSPGKPYSLIHFQRQAVYQQSRAISYPAQLPCEEKAYSDVHILHVLPFIHLVRKTPTRQNSVLFWLQDASQRNSDPSLSAQTRR
ncbi:hypothetical protein F5Y09DRAFT_66202 [Xylaria sp. FL1042]|nr:hypothetical protein F5Y09DRAFT_66202 [Xylaria sp. FL1042]